MTMKKKTNNQNSKRPLRQLSQPPPIAADSSQLEVRPTVSSEPADPNTATSTPNGDGPLALASSCQVGEGVGSSEGPSHHKPATVRALTGKQAGRRLRKFRNRWQLTGAVVARQLGVHKLMIIYWENQTRSPGKKNLELLGLLLRLNGA